MRHDDDYDAPDRATAMACGLWAVVGSLSIVLTGRAMAGAFDQPTAAAIPLLSTVLTLAGSLAAWMLFHRDGARGDVGRRLFDGMLAMVPAGLTGFATSVNASPGALAAVTGLLIGGLVGIVFCEGMRPGRMNTTAQLRTTSSHQATATASMSPVTSERQQRLTRKTVDGCEEIEAEIIAVFAPGERQTVVHLPIQPALRCRPHVECEPLDDASLAVRPTAVHSYGVRLEVSRSEPIDSSAEALIGVLITAPAARGNAA